MSCKIKCNYQIQVNHSRKMMEIYSYHQKSFTIIENYFTSSSSSLIAYLIQMFRKSILITVVNTSSY